MEKKIRIVKEYLKAMKLEKIEDGYYVRFRKSKNNKIMLDDIFKYNWIEEDGWKRIGDFEFTLTEEAFEELYKRYMDKLYSRSV